MKAWHETSQSVSPFVDFAMTRDLRDECADKAMFNRSFILLEEPGCQFLNKF